MKNVLIIVFNNLKVDARVTRQINFLAQSYRVTAFCFDANPTQDFNVFKVTKTKLTTPRKLLLSFFLLLGFYKISYRILHSYQRYIATLKDQRFDIIIANDAETLPLAFKIATENTRVYFDAHEYAPRQFEDRLYWRVFFQRFYTTICNRFIPQVSGMSTINQGLADAYERGFGLKPLVITNASGYYDLSPKPKENFPIKLVHHGIFTVSRSPELMIDLLEMLDERFTLDLIYMVPDGASAKTKQYFEEFKIRAAKTGKIKVLPALKNDEVVPFLHEHYDLGIILVPPINFNYENGLPNKLFECIQARLGMAVGPLREIASITNKYHIGVVSDAFSPADLAAKLTPLTLQDVSNFKINAGNAAREMNAQFNKELFLAALQKL